MFLVGGGRYHKTLRLYIYKLLKLGNPYLALFYPNQPLIYALTDVCPVPYNFIYEYISMGMNSES